jgi:hypothetical protein
LSTARTASPSWWPEVAHTLFSRFTLAHQRLRDAVADQRYGPPKAGVAVATFTVASTPRVFD